MACVFCEIVAGRIPGLPVWENRDFLLMLDIRPIAPGHLLLPKKHAADVFLLPEREYVRLLRTARKVAPVPRLASVRSRAASRRASGGSRREVRGAPDTNLKRGAGR